MTDSQVLTLNDAEESLDDAKRKLDLLKAEQIRATEKVQNLTERIVALGLDPDKPLEPQLQAAERDILEVVNDINKRLRAINEQLAPSQ